MKNKKSIELEMKGDGVRLVDPNVPGLTSWHPVCVLMSKMQHTGLCLLPAKLNDHSADGITWKPETAERRFCEDIAYIWYPPPRTNLCVTSSNSSSKFNVASSRWNKTLTGTSDMLCRIAATIQSTAQEPKADDFLEELQENVPRVLSLLRRVRLLLRALSFELDIILRATEGLHFRPLSTKMTVIKCLQITVMKNIPVQITGSCTTTVVHSSKPRCARHRRENAHISPLSDLSARLFPTLC